MRWTLAAETPVTPAALGQDAVLDVTETVKAANESVGEHMPGPPLIRTSHGVATFLTVDGADPRTAGRATLTLVNASMDREVALGAAEALADAAAHFAPWTTPDGRKIFDQGDGVILEPGAVLTLRVRRPCRRSGSSGLWPRENSCKRPPAHHG